MSIDIVESDEDKELYFGKKKTKEARDMLNIEGEEDDS